MSRYVVAFFVAIVACSLNALIADEGPDKSVPELAALSNYVGDFDVSITSKDSPFSKGVSSTTWILNGRYIQQTGKLTSTDGKSDVKVTTLMTYDPQKKSYQMWSFFSTGEATSSTGTWDGEKRTMTSVSLKGDLTTTTTAKFTENGGEEWSIVTTNAKKETVAKMTGVNRRRKK